MVGTALESSWLRLHISKFFFQFWVFLEPERYFEVTFKVSLDFAYIPLWFQKGIKNEKFVDAINIFWKYGSSAFQNRSDHYSSTFRSNFMIFWSSVKSHILEGGPQKKNVTISLFWGVNKANTPIFYLKIAIS